MNYFHGFVCVVINEFICSIRQGASVSEPEMEYIATPSMAYTTLYYTILYYTILCYAVLCCTVLYYTIL